jgi:hypothetical protein
MQPKIKKEKKCKAPFTQHVWQLSFDPRYMCCGRCGLGKKVN